MIEGCHPRELPPHHSGKGRDMIGSVVERRDVAVLLTARGQEDLAILTVHLLDRFKTVDRKPWTHHVEATDARMGQRPDGVFGVRFEPFLAAKKRLEGENPALGGKGEELGHALRGPLAMREVRIAGARVALRDAVEREQQTLRFPLLTPAVPNACRDGGEVGRIVVVPADRAELWHPPPGAENRGDAVDRRTGRDGRVLGVERQHQDTKATEIGELFESNGERRIAVAHSDPDVESRGIARSPERSFQRGRQATGVDEERRTLFGPHLAVERSRLPRSAGQNEQVEDEPPAPAGQLDDPRVEQELPQIAAEGGRSRRIRRTKVGDHNPDGRGLCFRIPLSTVAHDRPSLTPPRRGG